MKRIFFLAATVLFLAACSGPLDDGEPNLIIKLSGVDARFAYPPTTGDLAQMDVEVLLTRASPPLEEDHSFKGNDELKLTLDPGDYAILVRLYYNGHADLPLLAESAEISFTIESGKLTKITVPVIRQFTVNSVNVSPATPTPVLHGGTQQFSAVVSIEDLTSTTVNLPGDVIWTVTAAAPANTTINQGTTISAGGLLTVAAAETATSLTVTASSSLDAAKSDSATITVSNGIAVASAAQWTAAVAAINTKGAGAYEIIVTASFSMPGIADNTFTASNITVNIQGDETITLTGTGSLLRITADQDVTLTDVALVGHNGNDTSLVYVTDGALTMTSNATVKDNTSDDHGGGVSVTGAGTFIMMGDASLSNNKAGSSGGGGVYVTGASIFTMMANSSVSNNKTTSMGSGGGVVITGGTFTMQGSASVSENEADGSGGGVSHSGTFTMEGGSVSGNKSTGTFGTGGGINVNGIFTMKGGTVSGNEAAAYGGGVNVENSSGNSFRIENGVVYGYDASDPNNTDWNKTTNPNSAALFALSGTAECGTDNAGGWTPTPGGGLVSTDDTITVVNGVRQP